MKNNKFLKIYAIIITIVLILIMFLIPDSFFLELQTKLHKQETKELKNDALDFEKLETQKERILNNDLEYEYLMLDSIGTSSKTVECSGKITESKETGICNSKEKISYTKETKKDAFLEMDIKYIDEKYIFDTIKDIEPTETTYNNSRELIYKTKILDLDTDITIYTDLDNITQISISNAYMTYVFKYSNIKD